MLLELDGFSVEACTTIEQAKTAADDEVSAFVVDVNLSRGTSGIDLLKDVRAGETAVATNTIVIMTSGDHRRQSECQRAGADQFLLKPYPPNALSGYINDLLSKR
jgi:DNA-binding response OmpR family regulator